MRRPAMAEVQIEQRITSTTSFTPDPSRPLRRFEMPSAFKRVLLACGLALSGCASSQKSAQDVNIAAAPPQIVSTFTAEPGTKYPYRENMYEPITLLDGRIE